MAQIEILMPKMGESVAEATIIKWLKNEGDKVEADEAIIEIATDKVDSEVPVPEDGVLVKQLCQDGDVVLVGKPIALFETEVGADAPQAPTGAASASNGSAQPAAALVAPAAPIMAAAPAATSAPVERMGPSGKFYSPLVRSIAQQEGVGLAELEALQGSGANGRVTKHDLLNYLPARQQGGTAPAVQVAATPSAVAPQKTEHKAPPISVSAGDEIIEMDRMRRLIADHMVMSTQVAPHVTSFVEADVTNLWNWRNKAKKTLMERDGEKLTFTPLFIMAVVQAIKEMPMVNVQVDGNNIIKKKDINIGMAAALPSGNLIVPVIRNADRLNLLGLAASVNDLAARAREGKLSPDEIGNGTYTLTNVGTFGNVMGTPIINQPQVAIMATGAIRKKPAVIETPAGDTIGIRHMMFLSHSYDHRVVDGALGGSFVRRVADILEQWDPDMPV